MCEDLTRSRGGGDLIKLLISPQDSKLYKLGKKRARTARVLQGVHFPSVHNKWEMNFMEGGDVKTEKKKRREKVRREGGGQ